MSLSQMSIGKIQSVTKQNVSRRDKINVSKRRNQMLLKQNVTKVLKNVTKRNVSKAQMSVGFSKMSLDS